MRTPLLLALLISSVIYSQSCNCDVTLSGLSGTSLNQIWASQTNYSPGDVICIPAGTYRGLRFYDFKGTLSQPLNIKNCGGQVIIDETSYSAIEFRNSEFIQLTGTGDSTVGYGFRVIGTGSWAMGINLTNLSSDFEIDNIEIANAGFAGLMAKSDPNCSNSSTWRSSGFIMKNLNIHDNYFGNTGGEGIYIGYTKGYKLDAGKTCNGSYVYGHWLENVEVHNNIFENIGWDAIQLSLVRTNGSIHDNYIYNYATENKYYQDFAISFSGGEYEVFNNTSINGPSNYGQGYQMINGQSGSKIYNNVIVRPQLHGIFAHPRHEFENPNEGYYIANNTIIEPERAGVHYNAKIIYPVDPADKYKKQDEVPTFFVNNLVVDPGYDFANGNTWKQDQESYFDFNDKSTRDSLQNNIYSNLMTRQIDTLGLTNVLNDDYSISNAGSPLIDEGSDLSNWGITSDIENSARPSGAAFDIGSYEFISAATYRIALDEQPELWDISTNEEILNFYPNPTFSKVYLNKQIQSDVEIYSSSGQRIAIANLINGELNLERYPAGLYFVKLQDKQKKVFRVIKK